VCGRCCCGGFSAKGSTRILPAVEARFARLVTTRPFFTEFLPPFDAGAGCVVEWLLPSIPRPKKFAALNITARNKSPTPAIHHRKQFPKPAISRLQGEQSYVPKLTIAE
jgi:hypothetical protein